MRDKAKPVQTYSSADALLECLLNDHPERYVFRGQTREYPGPLVPSGIRGVMEPVPNSVPSSKWGGVVFLDDITQSRVSGQKTVAMPVNSMGSLAGARKGAVLEIPESEFQAGHRRFFCQPCTSVHDDIRAIVRGGGIMGLDAVLGEDVSHLLCQQYGLTSSAIDATTDPRVAMFFATRDYPHYAPAGQEGIGVVYRWPRENAQVAADTLLTLEREGHTDMFASFYEMIESSPGLSFGEGKVFDIEGHGRRWQLCICAQVPPKEREPLLVPHGAYARSRMGMQKAALIWPTYKTLDLTGDTLVGNVLATHQGEVFYFRHSSTASLSLGFDKFDLWPSVRQAEIHTVTGPRGERSLHLAHMDIADHFLDLMLRVCCGCSPIQMFVVALSERHLPGSFAIQPDSQMIIGNGIRLNLPALSGAGHIFMKALGSVQGIIDPGYRIRPFEAQMLVERMDLRPRTRGLSQTGTGQVCSPKGVPMCRYVSGEDVPAFEACLDAAMREI